MKIFSNPLAPSGGGKSLPRKLVVNTDGRIDTMAEISFTDTFSYISDDEFYKATQLLESSAGAVSDCFRDEDFPESELSQADVESLSQLIAG